MKASFWLLFSPNHVVKCPVKVGSDGSWGTAVNVPVKVPVMW
jgi:hypothetical protein